MVAESPPPPPPPFLPPDQATRKQFLSQQIKVEAFLFVAFAAFTTILALGRLRSRGDGLRKTVATYAFMGATYLVTYVPGLMNQSSHTVDLFLLWAAFLAYLAATANNSSCYTLGDNEDRRKRLVVDYLVPWPLIVASLYKNLASPEILVPVALIFWIVLLKLRERSRALLCATKSSLGLAQTSKVIVDFMNYQIVRPKILNGDDDHTTSSATDSSYEYLVGVREARKMLEKQKDNINRSLIPNSKNKKNKDELHQLQSSSMTEGDDIFESEAIVTDVRITKCIGALFASAEEGKKLEDTCLSFAMFWLLLAKVAGYKEVNAKLRAGLIHPADHRSGENLQLKGKGGREEDESEARMFRLVELELEFLYEYLYTNCYAIYARGLWSKGRDLAVVVLFLWLALPLLVEYRAQDHDVLFVVLWGGVLDTGFTRFVIFMIIFLETAQAADFLISKWAKVTYICAYLEQDQLPDTYLRRLWKRVLVFACRFRCSSLFAVFFNCCCKKKTAAGRSSCSKKTLAQYSVFRSYEAIPAPLWFQCWIGSFFDMPRMGQANETTTELSPDLKKAVVSCLRRHKPYFRNGKASLSLNLAANDQIIIENYVTGLKSHARVILVWHIATSLFEDEEAASRSPSARRSYKPPPGDHFHVATSFSKYCAYLVAFAPKLLPDHVYIAQCEFDQLVGELQKDKVAGGGDMSSTSQEDPDNPNSILGQGRQLHKKLTHILTGHSERWKTLAEFWTEILLFLALSDHIDAMEAHANHLCIGGEFITHLWALLTHEGCSRLTEPPTKTNDAAPCTQ